MNFYIIILEFQDEEDSVEPAHNGPEENYVEECHESFGEELELKLEGVRPRTLDSGLQVRYARSRLWTLK